jgi:hypothetical protein
MGWQPIGTGLEHGGYAAWEAAVEAAEGGPARLVPVLARFRKPAGGGQSLKQAIAATLALPDLEWSPHERDLLQTERAHLGPGWPHEVRFVAYAPRSFLPNAPASWEILGIGPGFLPAEPPPALTAPQDLLALAGTLSPAIPVIAAIDEGIGFLNARFRRAPRTTRFLAVWLQAAERLAQMTGPSADIRLGRVLTGAEIDAILASGLGEAEAYAQINRALYPLPDRAATARRIGHGSHVLDTAAGAGFAEPMAATPLLAVQLPPASIRETAGRRMEAHLVQGLRWVLAQVLALSNGAQVPPVVVNLSIGSLAGPGDATEFLADWFAYEIARHKRIAPASPLRITGAMGNARRARLAARAEARIARPVVLDWRLQPDDRTPSFVELRVDAQALPGLTLTLTPPPGAGLPSLTVPWQAARGGWQVTAPNGPVAAVSFLPEASGQSLCHVALAPSRPEAPLARSAPGLWRLTVATAENEPVRVTARVQRDDTPLGHAPYGRQSWLDHPESWAWDGITRDYADPADSPVTRQGSGVSFAACPAPEVYLVAALRPGPDPLTHDRQRAAEFSAEGVTTLARPGEAAGPSLSAPGAARGFLGGLRAAANLSGATARLAGTSMAAPAVARRLADYFRSTPPALRSLDGEHAALVGQGLWSADPDRRLGHGILSA